jgi:hypothetical protein
VAWSIRGVYERIDGRSCAAIPVLRHPGARLVGRDSSQSREVV